MAHNKRDLQFYIDDISGKYVRYMSEDMKEELEFLTPGCDGTIGERLYWLRNGLEEYPTCLNCGKILSSKNFIKNGKSGYRKYCGMSCSKKVSDFDIINKKRSNTNIERYGSNSPWYFENFRRYMQEKYGVEYIMGDD